MQNEIFLAYNELDPAKKDYKWANKVVSMFRMYWKPIVPVDKSMQNRSVMYGTNNMDYVKNSFDDETFVKNTKFNPLPFFEGMINSIVEEITKTPPSVSVRAEDPLSMSEKDSDIQMLKNRRILEDDLNKVQSALGLGPYKMPYNKFKGNVKEFDDMGLDEGDPEDIDIYKSHFQKLWYEIGAQAAINTIMKLNKFDEATLRNIVRDVFSDKVVSADVYVDQNTGEIKCEYIDPQTLRGIWGSSNDGKDDICRGFEITTTIGKFISMIGDEFDFDKHWKDILVGMNLTNNFRYTGFRRGNVSYSCLSDIDFCNKFGIHPSDGDRLADWSNAYMFNIGVGKMEFITNEATSTFLKDKEGNVEIIPFGYELNEKQIADGYRKTSKYQQQWYRCYFISTSEVTQCVYGFQKVYFQHIEGANDEYSNGTIKRYQEQGIPAVEIADPYIRVGNFAFYRFLWLLSHVKPEKEEYVLDEILTLTKSLRKEYPIADQQNAGVIKTADTLIEDTIKSMRKNWFNLRVFPKVDGRTVPMLPPEGMKRGDGGLDPTTIMMQQITEWVHNQIARAIGFNPMRQGANPPSRESIRSEENAVSSSQNATGYIYRMPQYLKENIGITVLNYISDIINFPDTLPYKHLQNLIGGEHFGYLLSMKGYSPHRLGIFVHDYNDVANMQAVITAANMALSNGKIEYEQWLVISQMTEPKRAAARLSLLKRQTEKKKRKQEMEMENLRTRNALLIEKAKQDTENIKANAIVSSAKIGGQAQVESANIQARGRLDVKNAAIAAEEDKQSARASAQKDVIREKNNIKEQEALEV